MILLDRFIIYRFLSNFLVLFGLLFIFGISIDVIVQHYIRAVPNSCHPKLLLLGDILPTSADLSPTASYSARRSTNSNATTFCACCGLSIASHADTAFSRSSASGGDESMCRPS